MGMALVRAKPHIEMPSFAKHRTDGAKHAAFSLGRGGNVFYQTRLILERMAGVSWIDFDHCKPMLCGVRAQFPLSQDILIKTQSLSGRKIVPIVGGAG